MSNHDRLLKQRNHVRSVASDDMSQLHTSMQVVSGTNRDDARRLLGRLQGCHTDLSNLDQRVLDGADDSQYDAELDGVYKHRASLMDAIATLQGKLMDFETTHAQPSTSAQNITSDQLNERIPEMELTEFDGNPLNFEEFWDDFTTSVDQRSDISTITKFKLLRKCLVGKAAACCKGYQLTKANYANIKSILEERYGDKETAIALHLGSLIRLQPASSCAVSELIRVRDECEAHIRALVILGFDDDAFGQLFAPILLSKLPNDVRLDVRRQKKSSGDAKWTMKRLRVLLSTEIELRASNECEFFASSSGNSKSDNMSTSKTTDTALFVSSNGPPNSKFCAVTCAFYTGRHYSSDCPVFLDVASRQAEMGNRCYLCLRHGHWKADCRANRRPCYYCKKRDHHCSLCLRKFGSPSKLARVAGPATSLSYEPQSFLPETICTASSKTSTSNTAGNNGLAIVETAVATVTGSTGSCKARLVLDCGSTKSFVSTQLARRIGAKIVGYDSHSIGRFGEATRVSKQLARHELSISLRDGSQYTVQMNAEERLAPSVTLQPLDFNVIQQHCKANDLAEMLVHKPTEAEIDVLVGLDYYDTLVARHGIRAVDGLVLKDSSLGVLTTGYIQPVTKKQRAKCATSALDNTDSRERHASAFGDTSSAYQKRANQSTKIQQPDSFTSTLRSPTSSLHRQTVV